MTCRPWLRAHGLRLRKYRDVAGPRSARFPHVRAARGLATRVVTTALPRLIAPREHTFGGSKPSASEAVGGSPDPINKTDPSGFAWGDAPGGTWGGRVPPEIDQRRRISFDGLRSSACPRIERRCRAGPLRRSEAPSVRSARTK